MDEAVQLCLPAKRVRYLLHVKRERCSYCDTGTRTTSVWATATGRAETVSWCGHCFNAVCEPVKMDEEHQVRYQLVRAAVTEGRVSAPWRAARPALEDLERRGLL
jgi:hypothetical protein